MYLSLVCDDIFGGSCYQYVEDLVDIQEARDRCESYSSHLVYIETEDEQAYLNSKVKSSSYYFSLVL